LGVRIGEAASKIRSWTGLPALQIRPPRPHARLQPKPNQTNTTHSTRLEAKLVDKALRRLRPLLRAAGLVEDDGEAVGGGARAADGPLILHRAGQAGEEQDRSRAGEARCGAVRVGRKRQSSHQPSCRRAAPRTTSLNESIAGSPPARGLL
jgi:hypothetical protein